MTRYPVALTGLEELPNEAWWVARAVATNDGTRRALRDLAVYLGATIGVEGDFSLDRLPNASLATKPGYLTVTDVTPLVARRDVESEGEVKRRWSKTLQELPQRHCAVAVEGKVRGIAQVLTVSSLNAWQDLLPVDGPAKVAETAREARWDRLNALLAASRPAASAPETAPAGATGRGDTTATPARGTTEVATGARGSRNRGSRGRGPRLPGPPEGTTRPVKEPAKEPAKEPGKEPAKEPDRAPDRPADVSPDATPDATPATPPDAASPNVFDVFKEDDGSLT